MVCGVILTRKEFETLRQMIDRMTHGPERARATSLIQNSLIVTVENFGDRMKPKKKKATA